MTKLGRISLSYKGCSVVCLSTAPYLTRMPEAVIHLIQGSHCDVSCTGTSSISFHLSRVDVIQWVYITVQLPQMFSLAT